MEKIIRRAFKMIQSSDRTLQKFSVKKNQNQEMFSWAIFFSCHRSEKPTMNLKDSKNQILD